MLISTKPTTAGEAAAIARSRQLTDFKWTPVCDVPTYYLKEGNSTLPKGVEITGFPYASTERTDKFFCENISFETFLSVIPNPYSKLYQPGYAAYNSCNYGVVCNGLVRYAFGIRRRISTAKWATIPGMREIKPKCEYTVDEMKLCDVLYAFGEGRNHVSLITDILKDENGKICYVEVSEAVRPHCMRRLFTPEEYYEKFKLFALWRYDYLDDVPPFDEQLDSLLRESKIETVLPKITVDNGNKSNYNFGETTLISVFSTEADVVEIYRDGELIEELKTLGKAHIPRILPKGYYVLKLKVCGESVEFAVNSPDISFEVADGNINISASPSDENSNIVYMDYRLKGEKVASLAKYFELSEEEKISGKITRPLVPGAENFKVYFENKYGIWTHTMIPINSK